MEFSSWPNDITIIEYLVGLNHSLQHNRSESSAPLGTKYKPLCSNDLVNAYN